MCIYSVLHIYPFNNFNNRYIERYLNKVLNLIMIFKNGHNQTNTLMKFNCTHRIYDFFYIFCFFLKMLFDWDYFPRREREGYCDEGNSLHG